MRRFLSFFAVLVGFAAPARLLATPGPSASAPSAAAPSAAAPPAAPSWHSWPFGRLFGSPVSRPAQGQLRLCSFEAPFCVHASQADGREALDVLREAERAYQVYRLQAQLPPPERDGDAGGSGAVDLYLTELPGASFRVGFEVPTRFPHDRAPVFGLIARGLGACSRATAVHRAVATAHLAAIDGGEAGSTFASTSAYLAMQSTGCLLPALGGVDQAQAHPEAPLLVPGEPDDPDASPLLPWMLDAWLGASAPGALVTALWYGSQQSTPAESPRFRNDPDLFTAVARLARTRKSKPDEMLLDLAVTRAFLGERSDGVHLPEGAWLGRAGRVRFDASWPHPSLPRRVAFRPVGPAGMVYIWVDLEKAPEHPQLGVRAEWEYPVTMRWAMVRVSPEGHEISRLVLPHQRGVFSADGLVMELEGAAGLLIVGVSAGEIDLDQPFHIDEAPYEHHGGTVHVFVP